MAPNQGVPKTPNEDIPVTPAEGATSDGYYGDDDMGSEELDLSFLDEDEPTDKK